MQDFYLRRLYQRHLLAEPAGIILQGSPIDLSGVTAPAYVLAGREDHISPWKTAFAATRLFSGPVRFVLGSGGHAGSILSTPRSPRGYWLNARRVKDPQSWVKGAEHHEESWWEDWARWVAPFSGPMVPTRRQAQGVGDAPGSYARQGSGGA
jgi:polyhydroxyalkanoate synthase